MVPQPPAEAYTTGDEPLDHQRYYQRVNFLRGEENQNRERVSTVGTQVSNFTFPLHSRVNRSRCIQWKFSPLSATIQGAITMNLNDFKRNLMIMNNKVPGDVGGV